MDNKIINPYVKVVSYILVIISSFWLEALTRLRHWPVEIHDALFYSLIVIDLFLLFPLTITLVNLLEFE